MPTASKHKTRKQFTCLLEKELIDEIRQAAIDAEMPVYELVELLLREALGGGDAREGHKNPEDLFPEGTAHFTGAPCGAVGGDPKAWPPGHYPTKDPKRVDCPGCLAQIAGG